MKKKRGWKGYLLVTALILAWAVWYVRERNLEARYEAYQESVEAVEQSARLIEDLEAEAGRKRQRISELEADPLRKEESIRQIKHLVRPGETVYRVELPTASTVPATDEGAPGGAGNAN